MPVNQALRIRPARLLGKLDRVHEVAAVAGQGHPVTCFDIRGPRLGVLTGKTPYPDHRFLQAVCQRQAHLQQYLEAVGDDG